MRKVNEAMWNWKSAEETAGYREKYAMIHGKKNVVTDHREHELWIFRYSTGDPYQDANGATYDATERRWVN